MRVLAMLRQMLRPARQIRRPDTVELAHAQHRLSALKACVQEDDSGEVVVVRRFEDDDTPSHGIPMGRKA